jgi:hypothetical protein
MITFTAVFILFHVRLSGSTVLQVVALQIHTGQEVSRDLPGCIANKDGDVDSLAVAHYESRPMQERSSTVRSFLGIQTLSPCAFDRGQLGSPPTLLM